jgi:hypothetical protein
MNNFLAVFTFCLVCLNLSSQSIDLHINKINWSQWEVKIDSSKKIELLKKIDHPMISSLLSKDPYITKMSEVINNFHFIDLNLDGNIDIVYSGSSILSDGIITYIWQNKANDNYELIFEQQGMINSISYLLPGLPISMDIIKYPFVGGYMDILEQFDSYSIETGDNKIKFNKISSAYCVNHTIIPDTFNIFIPFVITVEGYNLRLSAQLDSTTDFQGDESKGNDIAKYPIGSLGYALSERNDSTGRVWWFVLMLNNKFPDKSYFPNWENSPTKFYSYGWMSTRYLKRLDK